MQRQSQTFEMFKTFFKILHFHIRVFLCIFVLIIEF